MYKNISLSIQQSYVLCVNREVGRIKFAHFIGETNIQRQWYGQYFKKMMDYFQLLVSDHGALRKIGSGFKPKKGLQYWFNLNSLRFDKMYRGYSPPQLFCSALPNDGPFAT